MVYRSGNQWIYDTGNFPKGFKNVLAICLAGTSPENVQESVMPVEQLKSMEQVTEVPGEWRQAFGMPEPIPPKPEKPVEAVQVEEYEEEFERDDWREGAALAWKELWGSPELGLIFFPLMILPTLVLGLVTIGYWIGEKLCPSAFSSQSS